MCSFTGRIKENLKERATRQHCWLLHNYKVLKSRQLSPGNFNCLKGRASRLS